MTSILLVQHQPDSGPGALEVPLRRAGFELDFWVPPGATPFRERATGARAA